MGSTERGLDPSNGLRHVQIDHPLWALDNLCFGTTGGVAPGVLVERASFFGGTGTPGLAGGTLRTKTITMIASGTVLTRLVKVRVWMVRADGEQVQEVVTMPSFTAGQTARSETHNPGYVLAFMVEPGSVLDSGGAGDDLYIGELWSNTVGSSVAPATPVVYFANVVFGLPIQMRPSRRDASGGILTVGDSFQSGFVYSPPAAAAASFTAVGSTVQPVNMRYDEGRGGFKFTADTAPLTVSATQVVMLRTAWIGYPVV